MKETSFLPRPEKRTLPLIGHLVPKPLVLGEPLMNVRGFAILINQKIRHRFCDSLIAKDSQILDVWVNHTLVIAFYSPPDQEDLLPLLHEFWFRNSILKSMIGVLGVTSTKSRGILKTLKPMRIFLLSFIL